jgi:hypothetical protein
MRSSYVAAGLARTPIGRRADGRGPAFPAGPSILDRARSFAPAPQLRRRVRARLYTCRPSGLRNPDPPAKAILERKTGSSRDRSAAIAHLPCPQRMRVAQCSVMSEPQVMRWPRDLSTSYSILVSGSR